VPAAAFAGLELVRSTGACAVRPALAETVAHAAAAFATHVADAHVSARVVTLAEAALKGGAPSLFVLLSLVTGILVGTIGGAMWWRAVSLSPAAVEQAPTPADQATPQGPAANPARQLSLSGQ